MLCTTTVINICETQLSFIYIFIKIYVPNGERDLIKNLLDFKHWNVPYIAQHDFVPWYVLYRIDIESHIDLYIIAKIDV